MKQLGFLALAQKVLQEKNSPMSGEEIWEFAGAKGYDSLIDTKGRTPWRTIAAQIYVDMRDNPSSLFVKIGAKPRKFFLKELAKEESLSEIAERQKETVEEPSEAKYSERALHPLLTYYASTYMKVYTKTIMHEKSSKKTYGQWLHPDLVGVYFPIDDWTPEVLNFGIALGSRMVNLYSFEVKRELTFANIREAFFQAVSNSSWANEGYLVAAKISRYDEFSDELRRLSAAFGIGIISLDLADPDSSEKILPAKFKTDLDWDTVNKLAEENSDFKEFIVRVKNDISSKEIRKEKFDRVYTIDELKGMIKH